MDVKIRNAKKADVSLILDLLYQMQRPRPKTKSEKAKFIQQITKYISAHDSQIIVAVADSKIIGFLSMVFLWRLNRVNLELYIPELVVSQNYRRLGVGRSLMQEAIAIGKNKNCFRIRLESGNQRKGAHGFYTRLGFRQESLSFNLEL